MIYGYACVASSKILRTDREALLKTKAYKTLHDLFVKKGLPVENIHIDLITGTYRKRKEFDWLLDNAQNGDCVIITSIRTLGNPEEAKKNYMSLYKKNIGIQIEIDEKNNFTEEQQKRIDAYSTAVNGKLLSGYRYLGYGIPTTIVENMEDMEEVQSWIPDNKGRPFGEMQPHFKEVYWLYENYFLSETDTYHNPLLHISK